MKFKSKIKRVNDHVIQFLSSIDFYKITMLQFLLHRFPSVMSRYKYKNRTKKVQNLAKFLSEINEELDWLCTLRFQPFELDHINKNAKFLTIDFIYFLKLFQLNREWIKAWVDKDGNLCIEATGPIIHVTLFEIYVLKIVEEVYTRNVYPNFDLTEGRERLEEKINKILEFEKSGIPFHFADFGGRRAFSTAWHEEAVAIAVAKLQRTTFVGTSDVLLSYLYDRKFIGTMAHEIFQMGQALVRLLDSQTFILNEWAKEYRGNLGIALTDTLGLDKFLFDFDKYFSKLYDGGRHDSGDPYKWGNKFIDHCKKLNINPMHKIGVFSDGLNFSKAINLAIYFNNCLPVSFGIGTNFTNDVGITPLQIVMKIVECNGMPVAKVSDDPAKTMCENDGYINYLKESIKQQLKGN